MDFTLGTHLTALEGPILVTGHTGFKGTWLTLLLEKLGIPVVGISLPPTEDSLFTRAKRTGQIEEKFQDIRDSGSVRKVIATFKPSAIFHLAAQPLVLESYKSPLQTFETNVMGTSNVLDAAFREKSVQAIVVVTTDKVYRNNNLGDAFIESDPLAGKDPYSASKVGTESAVAAWQQISKVSGGPKVLSVRAGNVIGGGDWANERLLPDLIRGFDSGKLVQVRNAESTRPWQHVLDPLKGYVMALEGLLNGINYEALNFGPNFQSLTVREVVEIARKEWAQETRLEYLPQNLGSIEEAEKLQLDSRLARERLAWAPHWSQEEAVISTVQWWIKVLNSSRIPTEACEENLIELLSNTGR
jgi:CDP-glucose 4,6-dehydratase